MRCDAIPFASCYVYSPAGAGTICERSRLLRDLLKSSDGRFMCKLVAGVGREAQAAPLKGFFGPHWVFVPIPGRAPCRASRRSVAEHLAWALWQAGLGHHVWPALHRVHEVPKSATARAGYRPTVPAHYGSLAVAAVGPAACPLHLMLVDDVITKGRTLLAAAARLQDAYPTAQIRAFALLRTMGWVEGISHVLNPCVGEITWRRGDARRLP